MDDLSPAEVEALTKVMGNTVLNDYKQKELSEIGQMAFSTSDESSFREKDQPAVSRAQFMQVEEKSQIAPISPQELENLYQIKLDVEVVLGNAKLPLKEVLKLQAGKVISLDKLAGELVDLIANGKVIARGEVVVVEENFGIRILEIVKRDG